MSISSKFVLLVIVIFVLVGCTSTQKGAATGAMVGGGLGAIIGHQSGETGTGAAIGAAAGALGGAIIGEQMDSKYCPECGRRFGSSVEYCPYDSTVLKTIDK